jgi:hypothetical protein
MLNLVFKVDQVDCGDVGGGRLFRGNADVAPQVATCGL